MEILELKKLTKYIASILKGKSTSFLLIEAGVSSQPRTEAATCALGSGRPGPAEKLTLTWLSWGQVDIYGESGFAFVL